MHVFHYVSGELYCEGVPVSQVVEQVGSPLYLYSRKEIEERYAELSRAFPEALLCYSVKANSSLEILRLLKDLGAGFDVVSGGEIFRVQKIGGDPSKVVFAGVGKTDDEIRSALRTGVFLLNVESAQELEVIESIAASEARVADVALRVNPDVDPRTHRHITTGKEENKFGIDLESAGELLRGAGRLRHTRIRGLHVHIGSQITSTAPFVGAVERLVRFLERNRAEGGTEIEVLDLGGGLGIEYRDESGAVTAEELAEAILPLVAPTGCRVVLEPGRFVVGNAGILVTRVLFTKEHRDRRVVICDAGMNAFLRPALYQAEHRIGPVVDPGVRAGTRGEGKPRSGRVWETDLVGPICESADTFARGRRLPEFQRGDLVSIFSAGAYGYSMASHYNSHPRPAEVLVDGESWRVITRRERVEDLVRQEDERR